jgi:hypothetical protein
MSQTTPPPLSRQGGMVRRAGTRIADGEAFELGPQISELPRAAASLRFAEIANRLRVR